jgi:hypothetical protein
MLLSVRLRAAASAASSISCQCWRMNASSSSVQRPCFIAPSVRNYDAASSARAFVSNSSAKAARPLITSGTTATLAKSMHCAAFRRSHAGSMIGSSSTLNAGALRVARFLPFNTYSQDHVPHCGREKAARGGCRGG